MSSSLRSIPSPLEAPASTERGVEEVSSAALEGIAGLVARTAGLDLARYDRDEVDRRILRRMALADHASAEEYRARLVSDPVERRLLARDLLVGATAFFPDPGYFEVLRRVVIDPLVRATADGEIRVWVAGCSTGEEAYSIAILCLEAADTFGCAPSLQIFATDVDEEVIARAREGVYAAAIRDRVDAPRLAAHFVPRGDGFQVGARLRDHVCFGVHDLASDPPLAGMDLVSCRNLVRYLTIPAAERAIRRLTDALRPGAHLFLGATESPRGSPSLEAVSPLARIYRRGDPYTTSGPIATSSELSFGPSGLTWLDAELQRSEAELESSQEELRLLAEELAWARKARRRAEAALASGERRRRREQRRAAASVEEASRSMDEYLGMLGHELRNPLAAILAASDVLMRRETGDPVVERTSAILARQSGHMARIVDGLLDVSRIARGKIELNREVVEIRATLAALIAEVEDQARARGLAFACPPSPAIWVEADRLRLFQMVESVLANALAFTPPEGRVTLTISVENEAAVIQVQDTGQGIDPALVPRVFEPFWQGPQSFDRKKGGLGLGLALVKGLVALHRGTVEAASEGRGRGTTVTIRLPRAAAPETVDEAAPGAESDSLRVLVVEDNVDAAVMVVELLAQVGHLAEVAHDGVAALTAAAAMAPDVVICDLGLPGALNGYEVARRLRRMPALAGARIVALSGYGRPEDKAEAARAGFDLHLTKPVDFRTLRRALEREPTPAT